MKLDDLEIVQMASAVRIRKCHGDCAYVLSRTGAWRFGIPTDNPGLLTWRSWRAQNQGPRLELVL